MEYQLALPPDLGPSPADFVAAWNASAECCTITQSSLASSTNAQYDPLPVGALTVLSSRGIGLATNALSALIKQVLTTKGVHTDPDREDRSAWRQPHPGGHDRRAVRQPPRGKRKEAEA